jgi:hypothetical protein
MWRTMRERQQRYQRSERYPSGHHRGRARWIEVGANDLVRATFGE